MIVPGSTPDLWPLKRPKMVIALHNVRVGTNLNINHAFSGHVEGVELEHDVVGVGVLVAVLLGGGGDLLHAVIYA